MPPLAPPGSKREAAPSTEACERVPAPVPTFLAPAARVAGVTAIVALAHAALIGIPALRTQGPMEWDPAHHMLWGLTVYRDLAHGQWISLLFDTYRQTYWPFLHSWGIALSMLMLGQSDEAARAVSLLSFEGTAIGLAVLALRLRGSLVAPALAAGLWLTSASFLARFAIEAFTESLAIAVTILHLLLVDRAFRRGDAWAYGIAGAAGMTTYFTKTDYGIIAIASVVMVLGLRSIRERSARRDLRNYMVPIVLLGLLWFAYPSKILSTIKALANRPYGPERFSLQGLAYHFKLLLHWSDSSVVFVLGIAGYIALLVVRRSRTEGLVAAYVSLALVLHELSRSKDEKHITKLLPFIVLLAATLCDRCWRFLASRSRHARAGFLGAAIVLCAPRLPPILAATSTEGAPRARLDMGSAARFIESRIDDSRSHLLVGTFTELPPYVIVADLVRSAPAARTDPDPLSWHGLGKGWLASRLHSVERSFPALAWIEAPPPPGPTFRLRFVLPKISDKESSDPETVLAPFLAAASGPPDRIFVVSLDPGSPWYRHEYRRYIVAGAPFVSHLASRRDYGLVEMRAYSEAGVTVAVFDRRPRKSE